MSLQSKTIENIPCDEIQGITHIEVEVYYSKARTPRGYYISVRPVKKDGICTSYNLFSGVSKFLIETNRFSSKQLDRAAEMGRAIAPELVRQVIEKEKAA